MPINWETDEDLWTSITSGNRINAKLIADSLRIKLEKDGGVTVTACENNSGLAYMKFPNVNPGDTVVIRDIELIMPFSVG